MNDLFRKSALPVILLALAGCATQGKPPPTISLDEPVQAQQLPEPPAPVEVVAVPEVLPMPAQLKPLPEAEDAKPTPEPADEKVRVSRANAEARVAPTREGYVNAIQVWPFTDGALYQVYAAVGRVTVISLQSGEELVTVAAGKRSAGFLDNARPKFGARSIEKLLGHKHHRRGQRCAQQDKHRPAAVAAHHGELTIETAVGAGTTVTIELPAQRG